MFEHDDDLELIELTESDIYYDEPEPDLLVERVKPPLQVVDDPWAAINEIPPAAEKLPVADPWSGVQTAPAPEEVSPVADPWASPLVAESIAPAAPADPLKTATLAELYVSQGHIDKALDIYRDMLAADPGNTSAASRIQSLTSEQQVPAVEAVAALDVEPVADEAVAAAETVKPVAMPAVPSEGAADTTTVAVLEGWLENIRRIRECR